MNLSVEKISAVTGNGNRILTLKSDHPEEVKTPFGVKFANRTYCMAVSDGSEPELHFSADLDINDYNIVNRESTSEHTGEIFMVKWLHLK